jgi:phospholipid transport system substrate-binding protein
MVLAMANRRSIACLLAPLVLLSFVTDAAATFPTEALREFFAQANRIVLSPDPDLLAETRRQNIRTLAHEVFDFREAASLALGSEWQARTPAEREEFARLFADLLEGGYIAMMGSKVTMHGGLIMDYVGETIEGDTAVVRTIVLTRDGNDCPVNYQMVRVDTRWIVRDVSIDGVSLVANYRAQFQRVMRASSYADLMARMRTRAPDAPPVAVATIGRPPADVWHVAAPSIVDAPARPAPIATVQRVAAAVEPAAAVATPVVPAAVSAPVPAAVPVAVPIIVSAPNIAQAPPTSGAFWVQVGTFRDDDAVIDVMERLRQHSVTLFNAAESTPTGTREPVARVLVGPFSQWTEADAKLRELQASGFRPIIAEVRE